MPESEDDLIGLLQHYLRSYHCLLVLDNFESILQPQQRAGQYQKGYEGYGRLIQRLGETQHSSCLLLTSRDKPREVAQQEGLLAPVRSYSLQGVVDVVEGQAILREKGLSGSENEWAELLRLYSGNPLALKLVAEPIREVFGGSLSRFLADGNIAIGDLNDVLAQQIQRLSSQETDIVCWLAIEREAVLLEELRDDLLQRMHKNELVTALASLRRRSLVEDKNAITFTLQPVIMEYMTTHLVQRLCTEFQVEGSSVWTHYTLLKAQAKDYVRESQRRVLLEPVAQQLLDTYGQAGLKQQIQAQLASQRQHHPLERSYRAGNILNLLIFLNYELRDFDFSHLMIRQAYLQNASLAEVNFASAHFVDPVFTNTFGNMLAVAFSSDGKLLIAGTATGDIWIYDIVYERQQALFSGHTDAVWSIALSPDQHLLASSSDDGTVRLWDMHTSECLAIFDHKERVRAVAFHRDGKILMSGSDDGKTRLWNVVTGQCLTTLEGHTDRVWAIALCPTGDILATGSTDSTIRLWNITTGACLAVLEGHTNSIRALAFHPDGDVLASASDDETVRLWNRASATEIRVLLGHTNRVWSVAFSIDGQRLASGSEDRTIRIWETTTGRCLQTLHGHAHGVRSVTLGAHDVLASGGDDQTARLWDINTGYCLRTFHGYTNRIWSVLFRPDGQQLLSSSEDSSMRVWDVQTAQCIRTIEDRTHAARCLAYSPDGKSCASGGEDQMVHVWDLATGQVSKTCRGHSDWVRAVAFHPNGYMLASGGEDSTVRLWDGHSGFCLHTMKGHTSWVRAVAFSPDGTVLATCGDDAIIRLWDSATGTFVRTVEGHEGRIRTLAFHPQGQLLASGSEDSTVRLWDIGTGQCRTILRGHRGRIRSVAFSPDGLLLASSGEDQIIQLWDMQSEQSAAVFQTHTRVRWLSFHPSGELLASNGDDGFIRLWHLPTGQCVQTFLLKRPYEGVNITAVRGLTSAQIATLRLLGAVENT